jgi:hypothetical protein
MGYRLTGDISAQDPGSDELIEQRIAKRRRCGDRAERNERHRRDQE